MKTHEKHTHNPFTCITCCKRFPSKSEMKWLNRTTAIQKALQAMLSKDKDTGFKIIDQIFSKSIFELHLTIIHDRLDLKNLIAENDLINELVCITL